MDTKNENTSTLSPTPDKSVKVTEGEVLLNFGQAMEIVLLDKKIHKLEWKDRSYYGFLENGILKLHKPDGKTAQWIISDGDLGGTDYVVL